MFSDVRYLRYVLPDLRLTLTMPTFPVISDYSRPTSCLSTATMLFPYVGKVFKLVNFNSLTTVEKFN